MTEASGSPRRTSTFDIRRLTDDVRSVVIAVPAVAVGAVAAFVILPKFAYDTDPEADGIGSAAKSYWVQYYRSHTVPKKEGHAEAHAAKLSPEEARIAEVMEHITKIEKSLGIDAQ